MFQALLLIYQKLPFTLMTGTSGATQNAHQGNNDNDTMPPVSKTNKRIKKQEIEKERRKGEETRENYAIVLAAMYGCFGLIRPQKPSIAVSRRVDWNL